MLLTDAGFSDFERIIITCVDSEYPVASLGDEFAQLDVDYTASHEQRSRMATVRLDLKNQGDGRFKPIRPEEVCKCLDSGVVQLAQVGGAVVMGIPGDVYAFYPEGTGFGFGKPYAVHPDQARQLLRALAACGNASEVVAMTHPDCVLVAYNEGRYQICAGAHIDTFPDSPYGVWERELKQNAAASLRDYVRQALNLPFRIVSPAYVRRRPGILEAFYSR